MCFYFLCFSAHDSLTSSSRIYENPSPSSAMGDDQLYVESLVNRYAPGYKKTYSSSHNYDNYDPAKYSSTSTDKTLTDSSSLAFSNESDYMNQLLDKYARSCSLPYS